MRAKKAPIPRWRGLTAWSIRGLGIAVGAAFAAVYLLLMWESPPDIDWPNARLRGWRAAARACRQSPTTTQA